MEKFWDLYLLSFESCILNYHSFAKMKYVLLTWIMNYLFLFRNLLVLNRFRYSVGFQLYFFIMFYLEASRKKLKVISLITKCLSPKYSILKVIKWKILPHLSINLGKKLYSCTRLELAWTMRGSYLENGHCQFHNGWNFSYFSIWWYVFFRIHLLKPFNCYVTMKSGSSL